MTQVTNWLERKFEFSFPVELYPNLSVRLRGAPVRLQELVRDCPRELLVRRPQPDKSAQEHACTGYRAPVDEARGRLSGREFRTRARLLADILADFRKARLGLVDRVGKFQPEMFARSMLHPRLKKPMRLVDHLHFAAEHDDHHLAKIWDLIKKH